MDSSEHHCALKVDPRENCTPGQLCLCVLFGLWLTFEEKCNIWKITRGACSNAHHVKIKADRRNMPTSTYIVQLSLEIVSNWQLELVKLKEQTSRFPYIGSG